MISSYSGNSSVQSTAAASLFPSNPTGNGTFSISTAESKALGLSSASNHLDGYVGLSSSIPFQFNQTAASRKYDAIGAFHAQAAQTYALV